MRSNSISVSVVIPVYNEADGLAACLQAVAKQTVKPYEVIVVDNNSSDGTAAIARRFPFVTLITEPRQGVVYARTSGFDAARGDVIARIDGDTIIPNNWVAAVKTVFADPTLDATSGVAHYYNASLAHIFDTIDLFFRRRLQRKLQNTMYLWGANMAMRRSSWQRVRSDLCQCAGQHEDFDIGIHLQAAGGRVTFDERLHAAVSSRRIDTNFLSFMRYALVSPGTYAQHGIWRRIYMYEVVAICAIGYVPARLLHRGYNAETGKFSLGQLFSTPVNVPRVDPTVHVA